MSGHRPPPEAPVRQRGSAAAAVAAAALPAALAATGVIGSATTPGLVRSACLLPLVLLLAAWARRRTPSAGRADLVVVAPAAVAFALLHERLGMPGSELLAAALLYVVATVAVLRSAPALTRALGGHGRAPVLFLLLAVAFHAALAPWATSRRGPDGDEPWYLLVTHSLAHDLDDDLTNNYAEGDSLAFMDRRIEPQPGDPVKGSDGGLRSRHGMMLPLLLAPAYRVAGYGGAVAVMALLTGLLCWTTLDLTRRWLPGRPGAAVLGWCVTTLCAPLLLYSHQIWVEVPAALLLVVGVLQIEPLSRREGAGRSALLLALVLFLLPALKLRFAPLSLSLGLLLLLRGGLDRRRALLLTGAGAGAVAAVLLYNQLVFGNPLRLYHWADLLSGARSLPQLGLRALGLPFDGAFGLVAYAPIWLTALPGAWWLVRRRAGTAVDLTVLLGPYLLLLVTRTEWYGGWSPPFRYALVTLPFAAVAVAAALQRRNRTAAAAALSMLAVASLALGALWTAMPGWTTNLADGSSFLVDSLSRSTGADWRRWMPSATRPGLGGWLAAAAVAAATLAAWSRSGTRRPVARWRLAGLALLPLLLLAPTAALRSGPTRLVEAESVQVVKTGGHREPRQWTLDRTRFREGWTIRHDEALQVPVRPGGESLTVEVALRFLRNRNEPLRLDLLADGRHVGSLLLREPEAWRVATVGPIAWNDATTLEVRAAPPLGTGEPGRVNGAAIDWLRLRWSDSTP